MKYLLTCVLLLLSFNSFTQVAPVTNKKKPADKIKKHQPSLKLKTKNIEKLLERFATETAPGFSIGIIKDGKFVYCKGYGMADLEHGVRNTPATIYNIASLSKQFTGMCILLLRESGKLSFQDPIRKYLPELPSYGDTITIGDLVHQTSGLKESSSLGTLAGLDLSTNDATEKLYRLVCNQSGFNFKAGSQFSYSNTNYFLLGIIVSKISGIPLSRFAKENIFMPLGMTHTYFHDRDTLTLNKACGYVTDDKGDFIPAENSSYNIVGAGNLYTSIEDFLLWDQNFYHNKLGKGSQDLIDSFLNLEKMKSGSPGRYAAGLFPGNFKGMRHFNHNGSFPGYASQYFRFPDQQFSYVLFANSTPAINVYDLFDIYLLDSVKAVPMKGNNIVRTDIPNSVMKEYTGYYILSPGMLLSLYSMDNRYFAKFDGRGAEELIPTPQNTLRVRSGDYEFKLEQDSLGQAVIRQSFLNMNMSMPPIKKMPFVPFTLSEFKGSYWSNDLEVTYKVTANNEGIMLRLNGNVIGNLKCVDKDIFYGNGQTVTMTRENSLITGFVIETGRVKNMVFKKV